MRPVLPPGPADSPLAQARALHRDPLGLLRENQRRYGDLVTVRLPTARPLVVVSDPAAIGPIVDGDPDRAQAGAARRRILPLASPRSSFGAAGAQHRAARARLEPAFAPAAIDAARDVVEE